MKGGGGGGGGGGDGGDGGDGDGDGGDGAKSLRGDECMRLFRERGSWVQKGEREREGRERGEIYQLDGGIERGEKRENGIVFGVLSVAEEDEEEGKREEKKGERRGTLI